MSPISTLSCWSYCVDPLKIYHADKNNIINTDAGGQVGARQLSPGGRDPKGLNALKSGFDLFSIAWQKETQF